MAIKQASPPLDGVATRPRKSYPAQWWMAAGAGVLLVQAMVLFRWFSTGEAVMTTSPSTRPQAPRRHLGAGSRSCRSPCGPGSRR